MLEEEQDKSKHCNNEQKEIQKSRSKRPLNILQNLYLREIAHNERHVKSLRKISPITTFKLRGVVCDTILDAGHVFLGFTKDGRFVISYSLQVETDTTFPIYVYKLQWWRFIPKKPLRLISEVRLFGEQEIWQDLYIAVCQWPSDEMKIVVYGYCIQEPRDQQLKECYITITAIPTLKFCAYCDLYSNEIEEFLCVQHCFTIHTKYQLVSPFPKFLPRICLKIDGVIIINTGDSLVTLSTCLTVGERSSNSPVLDENVTDFWQKTIENQTVSENREKVHEDLSPKSSVPTVSTESSHKNHHKSPGTNNLSSQHNKAQLRTESKTDFSVNPSNVTSIAQDQSCCDNFPSDLNKDCAKLISKDESSIEKLHPNLDNVGQASTSCPLTGDNTLINQFSPNGGKGYDSIPQNNSIQTCDESTKENISPHQCIVSECDDHLRVFKEYTRCNDVNETKKTVDLPSVLRNSITVSTNQSCVTCLEQTFAEGVRYLREEDDCVNSNPVCFLPLDVHGSGYERLYCVPENRCRVPNPRIVIKQHTFDVEQFVHEVAQRLCTNSGKKYLAVNDYDIQIVDVTPETGEAIILAIMLIKAALQMKGETRNASYANNMCGKVYQAELMFVWNLTTGVYSIVGVQELIEVTSSTKSTQNNQCWNPGLQKCQRLQQRMTIPQIDIKSVKVLSNNAVLKGSPLTMLFEPSQHVALVL